MSNLDSVADVLELVDNALGEGKSAREIIEMVRGMPVDPEDIWLAVTLLETTMKRLKQ